MAALMVKSEVVMPIFSIKPDRVSLNIVTRDPLALRQMSVRRTDAELDPSLAEYDRIR